MAHVQTTHGKFWKPQDLVNDKILPQRMFVDNIDAMEVVAQNYNKTMSNPVTTIANLRAINTTDSNVFTTGKMIYVVSNGLFYFDRSKTGTDDGKKLIKPTTGVGMWVLASSANNNNFRTVGGTATAITIADVEYEDGAPVTFIVGTSNGGAATTINGKPLYKPGTTTAPTLTAGKAVTVWYNLTGDRFFIKASAEGNAVAANVLAGKTFSNDIDTGLVGTMANFSGQDGVASSANRVSSTLYLGIPSSGYYQYGYSIKHTDANWISYNIKSGVDIFGMTGTFTSDGTAIAGDMLSGKIAYVNGTKITGTIPSKAAATIIPGLTHQIIESGQYLSGAQTIAGSANLIPGNIKSGANIFGVVGKASVVDTSDANAVVGDVLSGKTAYVNGSKVTGTMVDYSNTDLGILTTNNILSVISSGTVGYGVINYKSPSTGYYNNTQFGIHVAGLLPGNIRAGSVVGNGSDSTKAITGTFTSDANAVAGQILSGITAYVNGVKLTGNMPNNGAYNITPTTTNTIIPSGYHNGSGVVYGDADLVAGNIKTGTDIFGVVGTFTSDATATTNSILSGRTAYVNGAKVTGSMNNYSSTTQTNYVTGLQGFEVYTPSPSYNTAIFSPSFTGYVDSTTTVKLLLKNLYSENIKAGINIGNDTVFITGTFTSDANAVAGDMLSGKTAYVNGNKVTGTIPSRSTATITPGTTNQTISSGQYLSGTQTILGDADLVAGNIKTGTDIFGVVGTFTSDANAVASQILNGQTAYVNGAKVTGSMINRGTGSFATDNISVSTNNLILSIPGTAYYGDSANIYATDNNWVESNIKSGVSVFGKTGIFTSDATAGAFDLLSDKIAYVNGERVTGTIPITNPIHSDRIEALSKAVNIDADTGKRYAFLKIPNLTYLKNVNWVRQEENDLVAGNIKSGATIFGQVGTFTSDATAVAGNIFIGKTAYVNGVKITGTLADRGTSQNWAASDSYAPGTTLHIKPQAGVYSPGGSSGTPSTIGGWVTLTNANFTPENIKSGVNIFGKTGTYAGITELYDFPLSIQDTQPTAVKSGHIWVKSTAIASITTVKIVEAVSASEANGTLMLVVGDLALRNMSASHSKLLTSSVTKNFSISDNNNGSADWTVSSTTTGVTSTIKLNRPTVYSKINNILDIETSYMWNGSSWIQISQKGYYAMIYQNTTLNMLNHNGTNFTTAQTLTTPFGSAAGVFTASSDGTYVLASNVVYKRTGDVLSTYFTLPVSITSGSITYNLGYNYGSATLSGNGVYLFAGVSNGSTHSAIAVFKNSGTTFTHVYTVPVATNVPSGYTMTPMSFASNHTGSALVCNTRNNINYALHMHVLFVNSDGSYSALTQANIDNNSSYRWNGMASYCFTSDGTKLVAYGIRCDASANNGAETMNTFNINPSTKSITFVSQNTYSPYTTGYHNGHCDMINGTIVLSGNFNSTAILFARNVANNTNYSVTISGITLSASTHYFVAVDINSTYVFLKDASTNNATYYLFSALVNDTSKTVTLTYVKTITASGSTVTIVGLSFVPNDN